MKHDQPKTAPLLIVEDGTPKLYISGSLLEGEAKYAAGPDAEAAYRAAALRGWFRLEQLELWEAA